jgi:zinc protease
MFDRPRLLLLAALVACGGAQKPATPPTKEVNFEPEVVTARPEVVDPEAQPLPMWPEVHKGTLPNGLTYYIMKHGKPEKRVYLWMTVNIGSVDEDEDQRGLAHFDEHMAFNGTKRFPKDKIVDYIEKIGMRFGADLNASTWWHETTYKLVVPTDKPEFVATGLDILRDWAGDVTYDPEEVRKERGVVLEEWRLGRGPGMRLFDKQSKTVFAGSRYADRITIGLPEIIKNAPRDTLYRYYKDWYRPDLMAVIVVGDIDPAQMEQEIKNRFGDLKNPSNERKKVAAGVPKADGTRVSIETDPEATGTRVDVANIIAHRSKASKKDLRRLTVERIYTSIMDERFAALRRKPDAPFLFAGAGIESGGATRELDILERSAAAKEGKVEDSLRAVMTEALRAERHGFTQAELDRARTQIARSMEAHEAREATLDSRLFVEEMLRNYLEGEFMVGGTAEKELTLAILPTITVDDLNAAVKTFGADQNRVITVSGPDGKPLPTKEQVLKIIAEVEKQDIPAWVEKPIPTALMATPPKPGKIVKEKKLDKIDAIEWTLGNGARVVVKPTDFENDTIVFSATSPGGTALASDKDFNSAQFAVDVSNSGGVGEIDSDTLQKMLSGKQMSGSVSIGEVTEGLRGQSSVKDLETAFQLLHLKLIAPRKDVEQFEVWKATRAEQLENFERLPERKFQRASQDALFANHPRRRSPVADDIKKVDLDTALKFYRDRFGDVSDFTFIIVGAFKTDELKPFVETYLASLPGKHRTEREKDIGARKVKGVVKKEWKVGQEPKARVTIDFHGDETWSKDKERDMYILSRVIGIRLREVLREDMGGVYGVGAGGQIARSPHQERTFNISFGCDPKRVDELIAAVFVEVDKVAAKPKSDAVDAAKDKKDQPVTDKMLEDDYLSKVKETYLRERETSLRRNDFWINELVRAYRFGDDPAGFLDTTKIVARMTPANVRAAAKRFIDKKQYYQAVMLPEKEVAAGATPPAATGGIPAECTAMLGVLEKFATCEKIPADARKAVRDAIDQTKVGLEQLKNAPADQQKAAAEGCKQASEQVKQSMTAAGC